MRSDFLVSYTKCPKIVIELLKNSKNSFIRFYYLKHIFNLTIFIDKIMFLPWFEYAESDFLINFETPVHIVPKNQPIKWWKSTKFTFLIFDEQWDGLKLKIFKCSLYEHLPIHWSWFDKFIIMHQINLTHLKKNDEAIFTIFWEFRSKFWDTWYRNSQNPT